MEKLRLLSSTFGIRLQQEKCQTVVTITIPLSVDPASMGVCKDSDMRNVTLQIFLKVEMYLCLHLYLCLPSH